MTNGSIMTTPNVARFNRSNLHYQPEIWDPQKAFIDKVAWKTYLVLPAMLVGILVGLVIWTIFTLVMRMTSKAKKSVLHKNSEIKETGESEDTSLENIYENIVTPKTNRQSKHLNTQRGHNLAIQNKPVMSPTSLRVIPDK